MPEEGECPECLGKGKIREKETAGFMNIAGGVILGTPFPVYDTWADVICPKCRGKKTISKI